MGFEQRLGKMNSDWENTSSGFGELPEGMYSFQLMEAALKETNNGALRVNIQYCVAEGEHTGEVAFDGFMLEKDGEFNETGAQMFKGWLERIGYEVPPLEEIEDTLQEITKDAPMLLGEVKKKGEYTNIRIREVMDAVASKPKASSKSTARKPKAKAKAKATPFDIDDRVQFENDGEVIAGAITVIDGDTCTVLSDADEEWEEIPFEMLSAEDGADDDGDDGDAEDTTALLEFIGSQGVEGANDEMATEELIAVIDEYEWDAKELTKEEVALLEENGIKVKKARAAKKTSRK